MAIEFECRKCSKPYRVRDEHAGRTMKCKKCGIKLTVPQEEDEYDEYEDDYAEEDEYGGYEDDYGDDYEDDGYEEDDYGSSRRRSSSKSGSKSKSKKKKKTSSSGSAGSKLVGAIVMFVGLGTVVGGLLITLGVGRRWPLWLGCVIGFPVMGVGQRMIRGES